MTAADPADRPAADKPDVTIEELQADATATRERLAASVEELAAKADVKARAKEQVNETVEQVKATAEETAQQVKATADQTWQKARDLPPAVLGAVALAVVVLTVILIRGRRRSGIERAAAQLNG